MSNKTTMPLLQFQIHANLDADSLLRLLGEGRIPCSVDESGAIQVALKALEPEFLTGRRIEQTCSSKATRATCEEITEALAPVLEEAVALVVSWLQADRKPT